MITQTTDGWSFTIGRETFGPYATRQAAQEAQYDAAHGVSVPAPVSLPASALAAVQRELADPVHRFDRATVEIGRTSAGLRIDGRFDVDGSPWVVEVGSTHWSLSASDDGSLSLVCSESHGMIELDYDENGFAVLQDIARLLADGTPQRLAALARQWRALAPDA